MPEDDRRMQTRLCGDSAGPAIAADLAAHVLAAREPTAGR
jgi:hypothetical protein